MFKTALIALGISVALAAAAEPAKDLPKGKQVHIVDDRCFGGCTFTTWTAKTSIRLRAEPDEASPVITEIAEGERVQGIAGRTITTYLPRCTFLIPFEGQRADCSKPDCERVKVRPGDEFFYREHQGLMSLIEYGGVELLIENRFDFVKQPSGRYEAIHTYKCHDRLVFTTWVHVRLPNGTTGWANREFFEGTEKWAGTLGGKRPQ